MSDPEASELGPLPWRRSGVYICPQAWFFDRCEVPLSPDAELRLEAGSRAHRGIGRRTDRVRAADTARAVLMAVMVVLLVLGGLLLARAGA